MHSVNKLIVGACPQSVLASVSASLASSGTLRYYIIPIMCTAVHNVHGRTLIIVLQISVRSDTSMRGLGYLRCRFLAVGVVAANLLTDLWIRP